MKESKPFKRAAAMQMQIMALQASLSGVAFQAAPAGLGAYVSRGHGRAPRKMCRTNFRYQGGNYHGRYPTQGRSECARRVFQALPKAQRAYIRSIEAGVSGLPQSDGD